MGTLNLEEYRGGMIRQELSDHTISKYIRDVERFYEYLGDRELRFEEVENYKTGMKRIYKSNTVNGRLISLNRYWHWLNREDLCVSLIKCQRRYFSARELDIKDYQAMVAYTKMRYQTKWYLILRCLGGLGIRVGELKFVTVEAAASGRAEILFKAKMRTILIPQELQECLLCYCAEKHITSGPVFLNKQGTAPLDASVIWRNFKRIARAAEIDEAVVYPHNFRHLFARVYMDKYHNIVELADILGHSSIETTRIYTTASTETQRKRMNDLGL